MKKNRKAEPKISYYNGGFSKNEIYRRHKEEIEERISGKRILKDTAVKEEHREHRRRKRKKGYGIMSFFGRYKGILVSVAVIAAAVVLIMFVSGKNEEIEKEEGELTFSTKTDVDAIKKEADSFDNGKYYITREEFLNTRAVPVNSVTGDDGRPVVTINRNSNGSVASVTYLTYAEDGTLFSSVTYNVDSGEIEEKVYYIKTETPGVEKMVTVPTRDKNNNLNGSNVEERSADDLVLKKSTYNKYGVLSQSFLYEYDEKSLLKKESKYSGRGFLTAYSEYSYDTNNRVIEKTQFDRNDNVALRDTTAYDSYGEIIREEHYTKSVLRSYSEYVRKEDGKYSKTDYVLVDEESMTYEKK